MFFVFSIAWCSKANFIYCTTTWLYEIEICLISYISTITSNEYFWLLRVTKLVNDFVVTKKKPTYKNTYMGNAMRISQIKPIASIVVFKLGLPFVRIYDGKPGFWSVKVNILYYNIKKHDFLVICPGLLRSESGYPSTNRKCISLVVQKTIKKI